MTITIAYQSRIAARKFLAAWQGNEKRTKLSVYWSQGSQGGAEIELRPRQGVSPDWCARTLADMLAAEERVQQSDFRDEDQQDAPRPAQQEGKTQ